MDEFDNLLGYCLWIILLHEEEICLLSVADIRELPVIDCMSTHHDSAALCLTEDACQTDDRYLAAVNDIPEHITCSNARQLVDVSDHDQPHGHRQSFHEVVHQDNVNHRALIHNQNISFQRVLIVTLISVLRIEFQKTMNGLGFHSCGFTHSLGSTTCRRC